MKKSVTAYLPALVLVILACVTAVIAIYAASWLSGIHPELNATLLPAGIVSAVSFFLSQLILPRCRFHLRPLISPLNWFLCMFFLQLVLVPLVVSLVGPSTSFLPFMPSDSAINVALLLVTLAFWSFCGAVQVFHKQNHISRTERRRSPAGSWLPPRWLIILYAILGVAGIALRFGSSGNLTNYFLNPELYMMSTQAEAGSPTSLAGAASTFLLSFAAFSIILLWCRGAYRRHSSIGIISRARSPLLVVLVALLAPLYSYNRATFLIPVIGLMAVMAKRQISSGVVKVLALCVLAVFVLITITSYRLKLNQGGSTGTSNVDLGEMFQDYGAAPQYLGLFLQGTDYAKHLGMGRTLLSSALSPVPLLGKPFRDSSGTSTYGTLLGRTDQPARFVGELFLDFNVFGVIFGFLLVGYIVAIMQGRFEVATEALEVYILQFAALWLSYLVVSSLEVVSQSAIYLCWPVYGFLLYRKLKERRFSFALNAGRRKDYPLRPALLEGEGTPFES